MTLMHILTTVDLAEAPGVVANNTFIPPDMEDILSGLSSAIRP